MVNIRSVIYINGVVVCCLAGVLALPLVYDCIFNNAECFGVFAPSIIANIFLGGLMVLSCRTTNKLFLTSKDTFLLVFTIWISVAIICSFPFYVYSGVKLKFISALFESVSGITTTGATVYQNVEILPRALNLWRFILHFIGGVGIIAIGIIILPVMRIGGMQLFQTENSDKSQKIFPRATQTIKFFIGLYLLLICLFSFCLKISGMSTFDSICHGISAISTGGFSTKNLGIEFFKSTQIKLIMSFGMFIGGITFLEIIKCFKIQIRSFLSSQQVTGYLKLVLFMIFIPIFIALLTGEEHVTLDAIATHVYATISAITTTGLHVTSFNPSNMLMLLLAITGGCSGSTTGGIKIFRIQILFSVLKNHICKLVRPFDISLPKYQGKKIDDALTKSVITFLLSLIVVFAISCILLEISTNMIFSEITYRVFSCLFNLGCGEHFDVLPTASKIVLICDMIAGRLEVIPAFIIFSKVFWKE